MCIRDRSFTLELGHAVMAIESQFGTDYTLLQSNALDSPDWTELFRIPGNGQRLYLLDREALDRDAGGYYRVRVARD